MLTVKPNFSNYASARPAFGLRRNDSERAEYDQKRAEYDGYKADLDEAIDNRYVPNSAKKAFKVIKIGIEGLTAALAVTYGAKKCAQLLEKGARKFLNSDFYNSAAKILSPIKKGIGEAVKNAKEYVSVKYDNFLKNKWVAKKLQAINKKLKPVKKTFKKKNSIGAKIAGYYNKASEYVSKKYNALKTYISGITYEKASNVTAGVLGAGSGITAAYVSAKDEFPANAYSDEQEVEYDEEV